MHFTYKEPIKDHLEQGDILKKTPEIERLLEEIHPHYCKADYTHFLVLTQSCDLVKRGKGKCNSRYISIACIRPFSIVIERELENYQSEFAQKADVCSNSAKYQLKSFIEKLLNNNLKEYFFLNSEPDYDFHDDSCAFLNLSIAIKIEHYDKCLSARTLTLDDNFKSKLGWIVGNIYSRVGTKDWVPTHLSKSAFRKKIDKILDESCYWVDEKKLTSAEKKANDDHKTFNNRDEIRAFITSIQSPNRKAQIVSRCIELLKKESLIEEALESRYYNLLYNDSTISSFIQ